MSGGLSNQKAKAIRNLLDASIARFGKPSLEPLRAMTKKDAKARNKQNKMAKIVANGFFSCDAVEVHRSIGHFGAVSHAAYMAAAQIENDD